MPIGFVLLFLMAVAPVLPWRKASGSVLSDRLFWPAVLGVVAMVVSLLLGAAGVFPVLTFGLAGFAAGAALRQLAMATRRSGWRGLVGRTNGGMIVHLGVILVAVALAASNSYLRQAEFRFAEVGDSATLAGHEFVYRGRQTVTVGDRVDDELLIEVDGRIETPALSAFPFAGRTIGSPETRGSLIDDVQLSVIPTEPGEPVVVRVTVQPLVQWLWIGGILMAAGTALALVPGRRRRPTDPVSVDTADPQPVVEPSLV